MRFLSGYFMDKSKMFSKDFKNFLLKREIFFLCAMNNQLRTGADKGNPTV